MKKDIKGVIFQFAGYLYIIFFTLICLLPFLMVVSGSFTDEKYIRQEGFKLIPGKFSLQAYITIFMMPQRILDAYAVSVALTVIGAVVGLFLISMTAYVLVRKDFKYRNHFSFFYYFTMLFNGGLVPFYILIVRYFHLKNSFWALLLPGLMNAWYIILMKNFMKSIPDSIIESGKLDGADDFTLYIKFVIPLSIPGLATVCLFLALSYWNNWSWAMLFIEEQKLVPLQYLMYKTVQSVEALRTINQRSSASVTFDVPAESVKMATAVVTIGPIIFLYPFVQKYFIKGLTIGSVKG
jgi:ABC-type sugar transport system, permease component